MASQWMSLLHSQILVWPAVNRRLSVMVREGDIRRSKGEGSASEIWFASSPTSGAPWSAPRQITQDQVYSEYPAIGLGGDGLWIRYHSDSSRVADMAYVVTSADGGATWGEAVMLPTHQSAIERAWVEVNFALQSPDQVYAPHDTQILVNGVEVGNIPAGCRRTPLSSMCRLS